MDMQTWKDSRIKATDAAEDIRAALASLGLPERVWGSVRPMVNHKGVPYVHIGMVHAETAELIAEAMRTPEHCGTASDKTATPR